MEEMNRWGKRFLLVSTGIAILLAICYHLWPNHVIGMNLLKRVHLAFGFTLGVLNALFMCPMFHWGFYNNTPYIPIKRFKDHYLLNLYIIGAGSLISFVIIWIAIGNMPKMIIINILAALTTSTFLSVITSYIYYRIKYRKFGPSS